MLAAFVARLRGWPAGKEAPFSLGRWGIPVTVIGLIWTALMTIDLLWPRDLTNPTFHRARVSVWLIGVPLLLGILYYGLVQRRRLRTASSSTTT